MSFTRNNIIIVGESGVGKTSVLRQFIDNKFFENESTTRGVTFRCLDHNYNGLHLKIAIWDSSSLPEFREVSRLYYKDVSAALIVYDVTNRLSFEETNHWINTMRENSHLIKYIAVVGNKIDLRDRFNASHVTRKEVHQLSVRKNVEFFETSAKLRYNIEELFSKTLDGMITRYVLTPVYLSVFKYKVILLGGPNVGKSSLVERFCGHPFPDFIDKVGTHFKSVTRKVNKCSIQLEFWNGNGQANEHSLMTMYYWIAHTIILVYDIENRQSFENLRNYLNILSNNCEEMPYVVLLGNKTDLKSKREVQELDRKELVREYKVIQLSEEVSAKTDDSFDKLLNRISSDLFFRDIPLNKNFKVKQKRKDGKTKLKNWFKCGVNYTK